MGRPQLMIRVRIRQPSTHSPHTPPRRYQPRGPRRASGRSPHHTRDMDGGTAPGSSPRVLRSPAPGHGRVHLVVALLGPKRYRAGGDVERLLLIQVSVIVDAERVARRALEVLTATAVVSSGPDSGRGSSAGAIAGGCSTSSMAMRWMGLASPQRALTFLSPVARFGSSARARGQPCVVTAAPLCFASNWCAILATRTAVSAPTRPEPPVERLGAA